MCKIKEYKFIIEKCNKYIKNKIKNIKNIFFKIKIIKSKKK